MTKRKVETYEAAMKDFAVLLRASIEADLKMWPETKKELAAAQQLSYLSCLRALESALHKNGLALEHIGLAGYKIPKVERKNG